MNSASAAYNAAVGYQSTVNTKTAPILNDTTGVATQADKDAAQAIKNAVDAIVSAATVSLWFTQVVYHVLFVQSIAAEAAAEEEAAAAAATAAASFASIAASASTYEVANTAATNAEAQVPLAITAYETAVGKASYIVTQYGNATGPAELIPSESPLYATAQGYLPAGAEAVSDAATSRDNALISKNAAEQSAAAARASADAKQ